MLSDLFKRSRDTIQPRKNLNDELRDWIEMRNALMAVEVTCRTDPYHQWSKDSSQLLANIVGRAARLRGRINYSSEVLISAIQVLHAETAAIRLKRMKTCLSIMDRMEKVMDGQIHESGTVRT
jgi:hypothetical protein